LLAATIDLCISVHLLLFLVNTDPKCLSCSTAVDVLHSAIMCVAWSWITSTSYFFPELSAVPLIQLLHPSPFILSLLLVTTLPECQCCQLATLTIVISDSNIHCHVVLQMMVKCTSLIETKQNTPMQKYVLCTGFFVNKKLLDFSHLIKDSA
jgi:hypothetical protein